MQMRTPDQSDETPRRPRNPRRARTGAVAAPKWDTWARPAGFPSIQAALIWAARQSVGGSDPIRLLATRLGVPYRVLLSADVVQRFLHSSALADARRNLGHPRK
ncbi:hypothetical protein TSHO111613_09345 [Tsukamurella hominis]